MNCKPSEANSILRIINYENPATKRDCSEVAQRINTFCMKGNKKNIIKKKNFSRKTKITLSSMLMIQDRIHFYLCSY